MDYTVKFIYSSMFYGLMAKDVFLVHWFVRVWAEDTKVKIIGERNMGYNGI